MPETVSHVAGALPQAEPAVEAIVAQMEIVLETLPELLKAALPAAQFGATLGELRGLAPQDYEALYASASALCDAERFREALPIAMSLVAHEPRDVRFLFIAATCLQRLNLHKPAAAMFGLCVIGGDNPPAIYRMAECLAAMGDIEPAREAFDAAHEMCRARDEYRGLQDLCASALERLGQQHAV